MKFLWSVLVLSTLGLGTALTVPGLSDWALLAAPCLLASAWLLVRERRAVPVLGQVVVDGSNVMHWDRGQPSLDPVKAVIGNLASAGRDPGVIFDANAGYKLADRYLDDRALARLLNLPESRVLVVPRGTPADEYILNAARSLGAKVVSNDRYRDWAETFPEVDRPGFVIRGGYREGRLWLAEGEGAEGGRGEGAQGALQRTIVPAQRPCEPSSFGVPRRNLRVTKTGQDHFQMDPWKLFSPSILITLGAHLESHEAKK